VNSLHAQWTTPAPSHMPTRITETHTHTLQGQQATPLTPPLVRTATPAEPPIGAPAAASVRKSRLRPLSPFSVAPPVVPVSITPALVSPPSHGDVASAAHGALHSQLSLSDPLLFGREGAFAAYIKLHKAILAKEPGVAQRFIIGMHRAEE
jgi:hypothetical protein